MLVVPLSVGCCSYQVSTLKGPGRLPWDQAGTRGQLVLVLVVCDEIHFYSCASDNLTSEF
jgi:hypothetical protein